MHLYYVILVLVSLLSASHFVISALRGIWVIGFCFKDALSLVHDFFSRCKGYTIQQLVKVRDSEDYQHLPKTLQDEIQESSGTMLQ